MTMLNNTVLHGPPAGEVALITKRRQANPWVSDNILLSISLWWVQNTRPGCPDLASEFGAVLRSLQQDLR